MLTFSRGPKDQNFSAWAQSVAAMNVVLTVSKRSKNFYRSKNQLNVKKEQFQRIADCYHEAKQFELQHNRTFTHFVRARPGKG